MNHIVFNGCLIAEENIFKMKLYSHQYTLKFKFFKMKRNVKLLLSLQIENFSAFFKTWLLLTLTLSKYIKPNRLIL